MTIARRGAALATAVCAALVVAAVGYAAWATSRPSSHRHHPAALVPRADGIVPWVDRPASDPSPPPSPTPAAPAYAPCVGSQLGVQKVTTGAATGNIGTNVQLVNLGPASCTLSGYPTSFLGVRSDGRQVKLRAEQGTFFDSGYWPANLGRGDTADFVIATADACDALNQPTPRPDPYVAAVVGVEGGGSFTVHTGFDAACGVHVSQLGTPAPPAPEPSAYPYLSVTLDAPTTAVRGTVLHFTVTLTDTSSDPLQLDPCPVYDVTVVRSTADTHVYTLNCDTVHEIVPGTSVTYAMQVPMPDEPGPVKLGWRIPAAADAGAATLVTIT